jgi:hypothetical protein
MLSASPPGSQDLLVRPGWGCRGVSALVPSWLVSTADTDILVSSKPRVEEQVPDRAFTEPQSMSSPHCCSTKSKVDTQPQSQGPQTG